MNRMQVLKKQKEKVLTLERLKYALNYDPLSGIFTRASVMTGSSIGSVCGSKKPTGYIIITIDRFLYRAHRLAWLYIHGEWPEGDVDHINRNRSDNRISNLRCVTRSQNLLNSQLRSDSKTKIKNVCFNKQANKYQVTFTFTGKQIHAGFYDTLELADSAARQFRIKIHGEFCCHE